MNAVIQTKCAGQWTDAEHMELSGEYIVQTHARIKNGAPPILLCWRCVSEWRASDREGQPFIAWIRSL